MKKGLFVILLVILLFVPYGSVNADMGPKQSLKITIEGIEQDTYILDLLSEEVHENNVITEMNDEVWWCSYWGDSWYDVASYPEELLDFSSGGLYSYTIYEGIGCLDQTKNDLMSQEYQLNYYPPQTFRIVLLMEDGTTIVSKQIVRIAFDTEMVWDLTGVDLTTNSTGYGEISGNMGIGTPDDYEGEAAFVWNSVWRTLIRIVITVSAEIGILFLFRYRAKRSYITVGVTNVITQAILSTLVVMAANSGGIFFAVIALIFLEVFVILTEGVIYYFFLKEKTKGQAILYALVANVVTILIGLVLEITI
jgi:hypothetical protein